MKKTLLSILFLVAAGQLCGQTPGLPPKVRHAEPLYLDLVRDLGARRGEREWNLGFSGAGAERAGFVEYEFAPAHRWGLEVEVPFVLPARAAEKAKEEGAEDARARVEGLKLAAQRTFHVSSQRRASYAAGYMGTLELESGRTGGVLETRVEAFKHHFFLVGAKQWRERAHAMVYAGPVFTRGFANGAARVNLCFHYVPPDSRHFVGIEINHEITAREIATTLRPQLRVNFSPSLTLGCVVSLPVTGESSLVDGFFRLIYEPRSKRQ